MSKRAKSGRFNGSFSRVHRPRLAGQVLAMASLGVVGWAASAHAATYVFDPLLNSAAGSDGSGAWDAGGISGTGDWYNVSGGVLGTWSNSTADTAIFGSGGTAGPVSVISTGVSVGTLEFNSVGGSYSLSGGPITFASSGTITTNSGVSATIGSNIAGGSTAIVFNGGGNLTLTGTNTYVGTTTINTGTVNFTGSGSSLGDGILDVGNATGSTAVLNLNSTGSYNFSNGASAADNSSSSAAINLTSGTLNLENPSGSYVSLGNGGYATLLMSGNTTALNVGTSGNSTGLRVGTGSSTAIGIFTQTGGTVVLQRYLAIANSGTGEATLTGGTITVNQTRSLVGDSTNDTSVLNLGTLAGGSSTFSTTLGLELQDTASSSGSSTTNLDSGILILGSTGIYQGVVPTGTAKVSLNLNGAQIADSTSGALVISNADSLAANIFNGGAIFNVSGTTISNTINANLLTTTGGGIYKNTTFAPTAGTLGSGYIGAPYVAVSGGSGTGATAIANVSNGSIVGFTMTNPGTGYVVGDVLTFTLSGGGATSAASGDTYTVQSGDVVTNGTGAVSKIGSGTLILSGTDTYTGGTIVGGGTLDINNSGSLPSLVAATNSVAGGATLMLDVGATSGTVAAFTSANVDAVRGNTAFASGSFLGLNTTGGNFTYNSSFGGALGLVRTGGNILTLGGSNTYTGGVTIPASAALGTINATNTSAFGATGNTLSLNSPSTIELSTDTGFGTGSNPVYNVSIGLASAVGANVNTNFVLNRATGTVITPITHKFGVLTISENGGQATTFNVSAGVQTPAGVVDTLAFTSLAYGNNNVVTEKLNPVGANLAFGSVAPVNAITTSQIVTLDLDGTSTGNAITGAISNTVVGGATSTAAISKTNTSTWTFSGASTYTGTTNISGGRLVLTSGASLGNTAVNVQNGGTFAPLTGAGNIGSGSGSLAVLPGGNLNLSDGAIGQLKVINTAGTTGLTLGAVSGSTAANLTFEIGSAVNSIDNIAVTGNASVLSTASISIVPLAGDASLAPGNYTLITAGAGLDSSSFTLSSSSETIGSNTYVLSLGSSTSTAEVLSVTQVSGSLASAFWAGAIDNNWETKNGSSTNWRTDITGATDTGLVPDGTTNVTFTVSSGGANLGTILSSNQSINSLTFNGYANGNVSISGNTLTINALALNGNPLGTGITLASGSSQVTISSNVALGSSQTWTNNSANPFNVSGSISGSAALTQAGSGLVVLAGSNTFSGGYNLSAGTLDINNASALGTGQFAINTSTTIDNTSGVPITLSTNNSQAWNADFTFNGSSDLNMGSGAVTLGSNRIVTVAAGNLTVGGIGDSGLVYSLTKAGPGNLNMTGQNSYSGATIVTAGSLNYLGASGSSATTSLDIAQSGGQTAVVNFNTSGTASFNGNVTIADASNAIGAINIISGTVNVPAAGSINYITVGNGGYGALAISGGSLTVGTPTFSSGIRIGGGAASGVGVFTQTGGSLTSYRFNAIANSGAYGLATYTGGTTTVIGNATIVGDGSGTAVMNLGTQAGGTNFYTTGGGGLEVNGAGNATATLNLNAGTLNLSQGSIYQFTGSGTGTVNLNGAVVNAGVSGLTLINNTLTSANVYNGGANFNVPTGSSAIVSANLLATTGNGIYAGGTGGTFAVTGNGSVGYVGAPLVFSISGGSGSGAMAVADMTNGAITGVTITNPGQGYQVGDNLTFTFSDGGYNSTATPFNYTLTAADLATNNGGLTKTGAGLLTLSGSSTYTGNTLVKGGTLAVASPTALGVGSAILSNGTTLALGSIPTSTQINLRNGFTGFTTNGNGAYTAVIGGGGSTLTLTNGVGHEASSSFSPTPVTISDTSGFTASFTYNHAVVGGYEAAADGITFTFQNQSSGALGGSGGSFGYSLGGGAPDTNGVPISPSVAAIMDVYHDEIGFGQNGVVTSLSGVDTVPGISGVSSSTVTIVYNGVAKTLSETISDSEESPSYTYTLTGFDLTTQLGEGGGTATGYIGFTGATGGVTDTQSISNFSFSTNGSTGVAISNAVVVNPAASTTLQLAASAPYSSGAVGPITIGTGGLLTVSIGSTPLTGVTKGVLTTTSVSFANPGSGTLDVGQNALDITGQTVGQVTAMVRTAYSNGTWTGPGITSTAAANDSTHLTALGVIYNSVDGTSTGAALYGSGTALGLFEGANPASTDVLVKYTYYGDTDLSGVVDGTDYSRIDNAYLNNQNPMNAALTGWFNGDFNYDGVIDGSDYTLIDNAFNSQGASLAAEIAQSTASIAGSAPGTSAVPEPTMLSLAGLGAFGLLSRRRRRSH